MITAKTTTEKGFLSGWLQNNWMKSLRQEMYPIDPEKWRQQNLLRQIEAAESHGKLAVGLVEVFKAAQQKKAKLLIGEKGYLFPSCYDKQPQKSIRFQKPDTRALPLTELIDTTIEKVVQAGGAIEFVEAGRLQKYRGMVMIVTD